MTRENGRSSKIQNGNHGPLCKTGVSDVEKCGSIRSNNVQGYTGRGAIDTGASSSCAPDLDHTNPRVRQDAKAWIKWLFDDVGFNAIRIDMAPGYATKYQVSNN